MSEKVRVYAIVNVDNVNSRLEDGWILYGSPVAGQVKGSLASYQAMVKYEQKVTKDEV